MNTIFRVKKSQDFSVISNAGLRDERLSFGARGIWAYLMTKPDDWQVRSEDLVVGSPHGREAVLNMLKELERYGYLRRWRERGDKGRYTWHTEVFENPSDNPDYQADSAGDSPKSAFPTEVQPTQVNPTSIEELNNEELNTHTPREPQTQTLADPPKPDTFAHSKANAVQTSELLRGAVLDTIGARMRFEMGSFSHADRMRLETFVAYLGKTNRTPADLTAYLERLPKFFNKPNVNRPSLAQLIDNFDRVLEMDLTPQAPQKNRWQAPAVAVAPSADRTQQLFAEKQARRAALLNSQGTP